MTTGDGGMVTFHDAEIDPHAQPPLDGAHRRHLGALSGAAGTKYSWYYEAEEVGFKYYMNDIAAAIGLVQLRKLDRMNARRRELSHHYNRCSLTSTRCAPPLRRSTRGAPTTTTSSAFPTR